MTDRYNALVVILDHDIRSDDAEAVINAIKQIRGVLNVKPNVADIESSIATERVMAELTKKLWEVLYPGKGNV